MKITMENNDEILFQFIHYHRKVPWLLVMILYRSPPCYIYSL